MLNLYTRAMAGHTRAPSIHTRAPSIHTRVPFIMTLMPIHTATVLHDDDDDDDDVFITIFDKTDIDGTPRERTRRH